jgi:hypothetical protein
MGEEVLKVSDDEWFEVIPVKGDGKGSEHWYDKGYVYSVKLTSIENRKNVSELAKKLHEKYNAETNSSV